jgi:hypothetical protein
LEGTALAFDLLRIRRLLRTKSNSVRPSANVCLIAPTRDEGTTMDELESYNVDTLKLVLDKAAPGMSPTR